MKKRIVAFTVLVISALCMGMLAGCGPSAEEVVRNGVTEELESLKALDEATLAEMSTSSDVAQMEAFGIDAKSFMEAYMAGFDYRIDEVKVEGDKADVTVVLTVKSFEAYEQALNEVATQMTQDETLLSLDESALNQYIGEKLMESVTAIQPTETEPIVLVYELKDNVWTPTGGAQEAISKALFM